MAATSSEGEPVMPPPWAIYLLHTPDRKEGRSMKLRFADTRIGLRENIYTWRNELAVVLTGFRSYSDAHAFVGNGNEPLSDWAKAVARTAPHTDQQVRRLLNLCARHVDPNQPLTLEWRMVCFRPSSLTEIAAGLPAHIQSIDCGFQAWCGNIATETGLLPCSSSSAVVSTQNDAIDSTDTASVVNPSARPSSSLQLPTFKSVANALYGATHAR